MAKKHRSNTAKRRLIAAKHRRGPGKPFIKNDPRINRNGQINKGVLAFNRSLRELLVAEGETTQADAEGKVKLKKVEWLVRVVWNAALKGEPWAVEFIAERTEGRVTQPVDAPGLENALNRHAMSIEGLRQSLVSYRTERK